MATYPKVIISIRDSVTDEVIMESPPIEGGFSAKVGRTIFGILWLKITHPKKELLDVPQTS